MSNRSLSLFLISSYREQVIKFHDYPMIDIKLIKYFD